VKNKPPCGKKGGQKENQGQGKRISGIYSITWAIFRLHKTWNFHTFAPVDVRIRKKEGGGRRFQRQLSTEIAPIFLLTNVLKIPTANLHNQIRYQDKAENDKASSKEMGNSHTCCSRYPATS